MIVQGDILNGQYRDEVYRHVLRSDANGCLVDPASTDEALGELIDLAGSTQDLHTVAMALAMASFFGWNLGHHTEPEGKAVLLKSVAVSLSLHSTDLGQVTAQLLLSDINPMDIRKSSQGVLS